MYKHSKELLFILEPFSKREALSWLEENNINLKINVSIRNLATKWKWHKSKVERFLKFLASNSIINLEKERGITLISFDHSNKRDFIRDETKTHQAEDISIVSTDTPINYETQVETQTGTVLEDNQWLRDSHDSACKPEITSDSTLSETNPGQNRDKGAEAQKKKKEKNQKKEKENFIKEKNIPYRDTKKEKIPNNNFSDISVDQVLDFSTNLGLGIADVEWQLSKFKDYWLSSRKKPPKNGVAAFRNWLRNSIEFKNERKNYDKFDKTKSDQSSGFERFLAGGVRAVNNLKSNRLDGQYDWQEPRCNGTSSSNRKEFSHLRPVN